MHTPRISTAPALAVAGILLVVPAIPVLCQATPLAYVPNLPYSAQFLTTEVETLPNGAQVRHEVRSSEARDSQGRMHIEGFRPDSKDGGSDEALTVKIYVPFPRQVVVLSPAEKRAEVTILPGTGPIPTHGLNHNAKTTVESLQGETIHGVYAEGTRTTQVFPAEGAKPGFTDVFERWVSPNLKFTVLNRSTTCKVSCIVTETQMQRLDRAEPPASLFEIPADYKIHTETIGPKGSRPPSDPAN